MGQFTCNVCHKPFEIPDEVLAKYPNWVPKFCQAHRPKKGASDNKAKTKSSSGGSPTPRQGGYGSSEELNLTLEEVLARFSEGPQDGLFTDGSARPNPGPGGWGAAYVVGGKLVEQRYGHAPDTTNNKMELTALIEGFKMIPKDRAVIVFTDSELCVNTFTKWIKGWEKAGWRRKSGPIKNLELIKELNGLIKERPLAQLEWIKAHNGWLWNEYADSLATAWAREKL